MVVRGVVSMTLWPCAALAVTCECLWLRLQLIVYVGHTYVSMTHNCPCNSGCVTAIVYEDTPCLVV